MDNKVDINRSNYENFVIDYLDGTLGAAEKSCFIEFLENNPDIAEEVDDINEAVIQPDNKVFESKDRLKKKSIATVSGINEDNYEEIFIAHYENDLSPKKEIDLNSFLSKNSELSSEFEVHRNLKLRADLSISFNDKDELKQKRRITPYWYSSVAAVILLLISIWYFDNYFDQNKRENIFMVSEIHLIESNTVHSSKVVSDFNIPNRPTPQSTYQEIEPVIIPERLNLSSLNIRKNNELVVNVNEIYFLMPEQQIPMVNYEDLALLEDVIEPVEKKKKTLFASVLNNQWNKLKSNITTKKSEEDNSNDPTYVQVLDTGIKVFNTITGSETYTSKSYNTEGKLTGYQIEGREVLLSRETPSGSSY